ncbi:MAG: hypothetical protein WD118_07260 [Phycisphaeraceae bacterium]
MLATLAAAAIVVAVPSTAQASFGITALSVTPSTLQAGGNPNVTFSMSFANNTPATDEDVRDLTLHLPPGLIADPNATARCPTNVFEAAACDFTAHRIGTATIYYLDSGANPQSRAAQAYNVQTVGNEPARLGLYASGMTPVPAPVSLRSADWGIDSQMTNLPRTDSGSEITITGMDLTLFGQAGSPAAAFMTNPTSCAAASTALDVTSYGGATSQATASFTPTGCESLALAPKLSVTAGANGERVKDSHPDLKVVVTQGQGEAAVKSRVVKLPDVLRPNVFGIVQSLCGEEQVSQRACTQVGSATATTPFLSGSLSGPVYVVRQGGGLLPKLSLLLDGAVSTRVDAQLAFEGKRTVITFNDLPDLLFTRFDLTINGGDGGMLSVFSDLCTAQAATVDAVFGGQNGKTVTDTPALALAGCEPSVSISTRPAKMTKKGVVPVTLTCHSQGASCQGALKLASAAKVRLSARARSLTLGRKPFKIAAGGNSAVKVSLSRKSRKTMLRLRRLKVKATATVGGSKTIRTITLKAR